MNIVIQDNECWICGKKAEGAVKLTMHHTLPKHIRPKKNVVVPVCEACHKKINSGDIRGIFAFAVKIERTLEDSYKMMKTFSENVIGHFKWKK